MQDDHKILVGEALDPPVGIWRPITRLLERQDECLGWFVHILRQGLSEVRIASILTKDNHERWFVEAKRLEIGRDKK